MMGGGEVFAGVTEKKEIAAGLGDGCLAESTRVYFNVRESA